ncbi:MAG: FAD-dependent oxidoreductase [Pseudomonadota bacterium]
MKTENVTVLGAGIVGICSALSLQQRGCAVTLIDKSDPCTAASFGNAGTISPWSIVPQSVPGIWKKIPKMLLSPEGALGLDPKYAIQYLPWLLRFLRSSNAEVATKLSDAMHFLCKDCIQLYRAHLSGTGSEGLLRDSYYVLVHENPDNARMDGFGIHLRLLKGAEIEKIDQQQLRQLEPCISDKYRAALVIKGQSRALDPAGIGGALFQKFLRNGGHFTQEKVHKIYARDNNSVTLSGVGNHVVTKKLVITAGAWSAQLLSGLGINIPLAAERGYHLSFPDHGININHSIMDVENHVILSQMNHGVRIAGIAEFSGLDRPEKTGYYSTLKQLASRLAPGINTQNESRWMGVRPSFPDSLPVIDRIEQIPAIYVAFGHSHYGLMMAPKTGEEVANLVTASANASSESPYRISRF